MKWLETSRPTVAGRGHRRAAKVPLRPIRPGGALGERCGVGVRSTPGAAHYVTAARCPEPPVNPLDAVAAWRCVLPAQAGRRATPPPPGNATSRAWRRRLPSHPCTRRWAIRRAPVPEARPRPSRCGGSYASGCATLAVRGGQERRTAAPQVAATRAHVAAARVDATLPTLAVGAERAW